LHTVLLVLGAGYRASERECCRQQGQENKSSQDLLSSFETKIVLIQGSNV
jgi:hypothetical protein